MLWIDATRLLLFLTLTLAPSSETLSTIPEPLITLHTGVASVANVFLRLISTYCWLSLEARSSCVSAQYKRTLDAVFTSSLCVSRLLMVVVMLKQIDEDSFVVGTSKTTSGSLERCSLRTQSVLSSVASKPMRHTMQELAPWHGA
jgi:hypothetical protein